MPKLTIDGQEVEVPPGDPFLRALFPLVLVPLLLLCLLLRPLLRLGTRPRIPAQIFGRLGNFLALLLIQQVL